MERIITVRLNAEEREILTQGLEASRLVLANEDTYLLQDGEDGEFTHKRWHRRIHVLVPQRGDADFASVEMMGFTRNRVNNILATLRMCKGAFDREIDGPLPETAPEVPGDPDTTRQAQLRRRGERLEREKLRVSRALDVAYAALRLLNKA